jgi:hypothetical protein
VKVGAGQRFLMLSVVVAVVAALCAPLALPGRLSASAADQLRWDLSSGSGSPGKKVTASSLDGDFPVGATITVVGKEKGSKKTFTLCKAEVQPNGNWSCNFTVPKSADGKITISLSSDALTGSTSEDFTVKDSEKGGDKKGGNSDRGGKHRRGGEGDRLFPIAPPPSISVPRSDCDAACQKRFEDLRVAIKVSNCAGSLKNNARVDPRLAAIGCRELAPGGNPLTAEQERWVKTLECVRDIAMAAVDPTLISLALLSISGCGDLLSRTTPIPPPPLEVAPEIPLETCIPSQVGTVTDCAENPSQQFLPDPAPSVPPVSAENLPTFGDILGTVGDQVSAPSASMVQEQHDEIRSGVCAGLPEGVTGCP